MLAVMSDLLITLCVAFVGALAGWWLRGGRLRRLATAHDSAREDADRAREVLAHLHELADRVATDVGQHTSRVEAINEELNSCPKDQESQAVALAVANLVQANREMQQRLATAEEKLQEQSRLVQSHAAEARTDALTQLANRRAFDDALARCQQEVRHSGRPCSVIMADVDHFKKFNDTYGHQAGDAVLRRVGSVLGERARGLGLAVRYGGEEFAVILPHADADAVKTVSERIRVGIQQSRFKFAGQEVQVTASFGAAGLLDGEDVAALVGRADAALYASKQAGRNCGHWHDGQAPQRIGAAPQTSQPAPAATDPPPAPRPRQRSGPDVAPNEPGNAIQDEDGPRAGLRNRTAFCTILGNRLAEWRRGAPAPPVLLVEIDNYAAILSSHGSQVGNLVLGITAHFLTRAIHEPHVVALYDRTTLGVLLPASGVDNALTIAEHLREAIARNTLPLDQGQLKFTVSVGVAETIETDGLERFLRRAEEALEAAKKSGGNCTYYHNGQRSQAAVALTAGSSREPFETASQQTPATV